MPKLTKDEQKVLAARTAVDTLISEGKIASGMKLGLGTGSTAMPAVKRIAERIADGTLSDIKAVATSFQTENACQELGIPVYSMNARAIGGKLDVTIDGADAIDGDCNLIKGGGAALLREKIVAYNSSRFVIVADSSKAVDGLGNGFPLPVEIIPEARVSIVHTLETMGATCTLREGVKKCGPVITDNGNQILDCVWKSPVDATVMESELKQIPGVVETGFFTRLLPTVFIAHEDGSVEVR